MFSSFMQHISSDLNNNKIRSIYPTVLLSISTEWQFISLYNAIKPIGLQCMVRS